MAFSVNFFQTEKVLNKVTFVDNFSQCSDQPCLYSSILYFSSHKKLYQKRVQTRVQKSCF